MKIFNRLAAVVIIACVFLLPFISLAQVWCNKPSGAGVRQAMFADTQKLIPLLERLSQDKPFVVIRKPSTAALSPNKKEYSDAWKASLEQQLREDGKSESEISQILNYSEEIYTDDFVTSQKGYIGEGEDTAQLAYFYSNSKKFIDDVEAVGGENGATMMASEVDYKNLFEGQPPPPPIFSLIEKWDVKYIFMDEIDISPQLLDYLPNDRTILRIPSADNINRQDLIRLVVGDVPEKSVVMFAMPTSAKEATAWGFDTAKAQDYADAGAGMLKKLKKQNAEVVMLSGFSANDVTQTIQNTVARGRRITLVGEADDNGKSLRIPGVSTSFAIDANNESLAGATMIFCNSEAAKATEGLSVVGRIYTDQAERLLMALAGQQTSGIFDRLFATLDSFTAAHRYSPPLGNWIVDAASLSHDKTIDVFRVMKPEVTSQNASLENPNLNENTNPANPHDGSLWLFLTGLVGAVIKEFFRWRQLFAKGRLDKFKSPAFYAFSLGFALAGGVAGLLFGQLIADKNWASVVAFVAGVGLEEIVKLASRLKIWSPAVPMGGSKSTNQGTILEFLRHP